MKEPMYPVNHSLPQDLFYDFVSHLLGNKSANGDLSHRPVDLVVTSTWSDSGEDNSKILPGTPATWHCFPLVGISHYFYR